MPVRPTDIAVFRVYKAGCEVTNRSECLQTGWLLLITLSYFHVKGVEE